MLSFKEYRDMNVKMEELSRSIEEVEEVEGSEGEIDEASIRDAERALSQHAQRKIDHENKYGPMSPSDLVTHEKTRKLLLTKKVAAQRAYNKRVNNESMVARVQGGRKMVSAEAALRHARELAQKRQPGSKPTLSDIAHAHRNLTSGIKHESEENESIDESFAVKDSSGKTVDVKFSESEAKKRAEELSKKTGQKHSVKFERTAMVQTIKEDTEGKDTVRLEIPALIRALEWAREDAKTDVEIHKFVERLINHEGTVDMEFFSEGVIPSADRKVDKNGRPYPAHQVHVGTNESVDHLPQEAVGKSNKKIAEMLADELKRVGIKLIKADPFPGQKGTIWSVESSQYPDQVVTLEWSARTPGGRGINKEKNINLSFELYNKDGTRFEPTRMNRLNLVAAITFDGIGKIYKERVL